ncbi:MAG: dihydroorotase [Lachnospiraceae bacterium]|nr:dihydroorotase [Lachnospiraceae bacterium]
MKLSNILIKGIRILDPARKNEWQGEILINNGVVERIEKVIEAGDLQDIRVIDGTGLCIAPGFVDVHVHFRDPGFTWKEDIHTGALAAAAGGYTSVVMMANTKPALDSPDLLKEVSERAAKEDIRIYTAANLTRGMKGEELTELRALEEAGADCFSDDGKPVLSEALLRKAFEELVGVPIISLHEEDPAYIGNPGINAGVVAERLGIMGADRQAEISMVERDIRLALETGARIDIQHISTKEAVELVRQAKKQSDGIYAEATPHHFTLTEEAVLKYGANAKMNPPLRTEEDRLAIIEGLRDGTIDMIATDHAPHSREEKGITGPVASGSRTEGSRDIERLLKAPSGIIGLQTTLALGITELVDKGYLSLLRLMELMSTAPGRIFKIYTGQFLEGAPADFVIFNPTEKWVFTEKDCASKSFNTPFAGRELTGRVKYTICGGKIIYE